jgi:hypothetical protein
LLRGRRIEQFHQGLALLDDVEPHISCHDEYGVASVGSIGWLSVAVFMFSPEFVGL